MTGVCIFFFSGEKGLQSNAEHPNLNQPDFLISQNFFSPPSSLFINKSSHVFFLEALINAIQMDFIFSSKVKVTHTHVNGLRLFLCVD